MRFPLRNRFLNALLASLLVATPLLSVAAIAHAQPDEEGDGDTDKSADMPADDEEAPPAPTPKSGDGDDQGGGWGVGGVEEEGRFKPSGSTGKLKEREDEEKAEKDFIPPELPPPGYAYLDTAIGFGDMLIVAQDSGPTKISPTASFVIGLGYRIGDTWNLGLRFPISTGASDGPIDPFIEGARNPDAYKQIAIGAPELSVTPHFVLSSHVRVPVGLALTLPVASGDMFPDVDHRAQLGQAIVNQAAAASRGWEDRALFAYNRFGIIPSGGMLFEDSVGPGKLRVEANMKFEIMARVGGNDAPTADQLGPAELPGSVRGVSFNWVTRGAVFYDFFDGLLSPGVKLWFAFATGHETKGTLDPGGAQFVFEPNITTHIPITESKNLGFDGRLGYMIPLGGELGGGNIEGASIGGLRLTAGMFFGP